MSLLGSLRNTVIKIINKFNVDGVDYTIQPLLDPVPTEGSPLAVESGGVYADKSSVPLEGSTKNFTAGGMFLIYNWLQKFLQWSMSLVETLAGTFSATFTGSSRFGYYNGLFVCGAKESMLWSENGVDWNAGTVSITGTLSYVRAVCCHNGFWVVSSTAPHTLWSEDGKNWEESASNTGKLSTVVYAAGLWVGIGRGIWWSEDGKNWTQCSGTSTLDVDYDASRRFMLAYADGIWVAATANNQGMWWSENGKDWVQGTGIVSSSNNIMKCVCHADGLWVATSSVSGAYWSTDGKHWEQSDYTGNKALDIAYCNGVWLITCDGTFMLRSLNGKNWTQITGASTSYGYITTNGVAFFCGLQNKGFTYSFDGLTWQPTKFTKPDSSKIYNFYDLFYAAGTLLSTSDVGSSTHDDKPIFYAKVPPLLPA